MYCEVYITYHVYIYLSCTTRIHIASVCTGIVCGYVYAV